jgi:hypothetical protein
MPSIDYDALKVTYPVPQVLAEVWGIHAIRRDRGGWHGRCPVCGHSPRSDTLSWTDRLWYCHRCCRGGSVIDLYVAVYGQQLHEAAAELVRRMGGRPPWTHRRREQRRGAVRGSGGR